MSATHSGKRIENFEDCVSLVFVIRKNKLDHED